MTKLGGGLRGGMKQQDMTRRLDDNISAADFDRSRRPRAFGKTLRTVSEKLFFIFIGVAVAFCIVRLTLQNMPSGKVHGMLVPILGKNTAFVEQALTGSSEDDKKDIAADDPDKKPDKPDKPTKPKKKRHRRHG